MKTPEQLVVDGEGRHDRRELHRHDDGALVARSAAVAGLGAGTSCQGQSHQPGGAHHVSSSMGSESDS